MFTFRTQGTPLREYHSNGRCSLPEMQADLRHSSLSAGCGALFVLTLVILDQQPAIRLTNTSMQLLLHINPPMLWCKHYINVLWRCRHTHRGRQAGPVGLTGISQKDICNLQELTEHKPELAPTEEERIWPGRNRRTM